MRGAHPCLERAEWMLHRLPSQTHLLRRLAEAFLHGVNDCFMFPASDAALRAGRTVSLEQAASTRRCCIHIHDHAFIHCLETARHGMPGRAAILIPIRHVDEVLLTEPAVGLGA